MNGLRLHMYLIGRLSINDMLTLFPQETVSSVISKAQSHGSNHGEGGNGNSGSGR